MMSGDARGPAAPAQPSRAAARDREALIVENLLLRLQLAVPPAGGGAAIRLTPINAATGYIPG